MQAIRHLAISVIAATILLASCATAPTAMQQSLEQVAIEAATTIAIQKESKTPADYPATAAKVRQIALTVQSFAAGQAVTIAAIQEVVNAQIAKLNLSPEQGIIAQTLVTTAITLLETKQADGKALLDPATMVYVNDVITWVLDACALYPSA